MSLNLVGAMWRSSWWLGSRRLPTPSRSSSPSRLLRPTQTVHLKSTKESVVEAPPHPWVMQVLGTKEDGRITRRSVSGVMERIG
ncbi:hypothetical protein Taro_010177 [Colocasia esculenta]|uniref:Uncharacterized protein n=1 Tax=Colocasia esculenta TaxID=4460 RepID=A0A843U6W2_COLES|nr:hypothetical protein [Colocasia esculenta]